MNYWILGALAETETEEDDEEDEGYTEKKES